MQKLQRIIDVSIEMEEGQFLATAHNLNVSATADNIEELTSRLLEKLEDHYREDGYWLDYDNLCLRVDLVQLFKEYRALNAKFLAHRIGMNPTLLSQYIIGVKKPSKNQMNKIVRGINEIGKELAGLEFK